MADKRLQKLTDVELQKWTPAVTAISRLEKILTPRSSAVRAIYPWLTTEFVRVGAMGVQTRHQIIRGAVEIAGSDWPPVDHLVNDSTFWTTGTLTIFNYGGREPDIGHAIYLGVKFEPVGFERMMAEISPSEASSDPPPVPAKSERKGQVREDHLRAWHVAYVAIYGGTQRDTLQFALESALAMFPDKEVTREAVRKVIASETGPRKPGPKT